MKKSSNNVSICKQMLTLVFGELTNGLMNFNWNPISSNHSWRQSFLFLQASDQGDSGDKSQKPNQREEDSGEPAAKKPHGKISIFVSFASEKSRDKDK